MRRLLWLLAILGVIGGISPNAMAGVQVNDNVYINTLPNPPWNQAEGPFRAIFFSDGLDPGVTLYGSQTPILDTLVFCVQTTQYFQPGPSSTHNTFNINHILTQSDTNYQLSGYSAWVYEKFEALAKAHSVIDSTGKYIGGSFAGTPPSGFTTWGQVMNDYQEAIWAGMLKNINDTIGGSTSVYATFSIIGHNFGTQQSYYDTLGIGTTEFNSSGWGIGNTGDESIIQLGGPNATYGQDQIFLTKVHDTGIPEPASLAIWAIAGGLGAAGMAVKRRRQGRWSDENRQAIMDIVHGRSRN